MNVVPRDGQPTIYDSDFDLRVMARAKIEAGLLPDTRVAADLRPSFSEHPEPCRLCDEPIDSDEPWVQLIYSPAPDIELHELCYLAWCTEVLEG
jgi:hypothetical protein